MRKCSLDCPYAQNLQCGVFACILDTAHDPRYGGEPCVRAMPEEVPRDDHRMYVHRFVWSLAGGLWLVKRADRVLATVTQGVGEQAVEASKLTPACVGDKVSTSLGPPGKIECFDTSGPYVYVLTDVNPMMPTLCKKLKLSMVRRAN